MDDVGKGSKIPPENEESNTRRSSRAIKRKRFDDEIVDSGSSSPPPPPPPSHAPLKPEYDGDNSKKPPHNKPKSSSSSSSSSKKKKKVSSTKNLGRWKPTDDLALITAVLQTNDLSSAYRGTKFSCHFTLCEVTERWSTLLYNPVISKLAVQAMRNLHPEVTRAVQKKTLFSQKEEAALCAVPAYKASRPKDKPDPSLDEFHELLRTQPLDFHYTRTPSCLLRHWQSMKQHFLLPDQAVHPLPRDNHILNFLDAEEAINDGELFEPKDAALDKELAAVDRKAKKEIRHLENEVIKWQVMVDKVNGNNPPDFDGQTLAVLRGRIVRYLMRSKEITLGRSTADSSVDVDLKLEGPAAKISRKQGFIKLQNSGEFYIYNEGKRSIFVDGKPVSRAGSCRLYNDSVLEIASLKFVFLMNQDLIEAIKQEAGKI